MSLTLFEKTPLSQALAQFPLAPTSPETNKHQWLLDLSGIAVISDIGGLRWWPRLACGLKWAVLAMSQKCIKKSHHGIAGMRWYCMLASLKLKKLQQKTNH